MKSVIIIPARLASTRLPGKLLLKETGKSVLQHTYEASRKSQKVDKVIVAADDESIVNEVRSFGGEVQMTAPDHVCGTDRVAEVAATLDEYEIIVNVQGDEPEISADAIDQLIDLLEQNSDVPMATLSTPIRCRNMLEDPSCVKVVADQRGRAIYFSRSVIPYPRQDGEEWLAAEPASYFQHVGLYGYRKEFLLRISTLPVPAIEKIESLEQLRVLHAGHQILVGEIDHPIAGIDTPEDYAAFVRRQTS